MTHIHKFKLRVREVDGKVFGYRLCDCGVEENSNGEPWYKRLGKKIYEFNRKRPGNR